jgi:hypothetical protein
MKSKNIIFLGILFIFANSTLTNATRENLYGISSHNPLVTQWEFFYGGPGEDRARGIIQTSDGGFAFVGRTTSYGVGGNDGWLVKTDANGVVQWNQTYGGNLNDDLISIIETADKGFFLAGTTESFGNGENDIWLIKTDSIGNPEWNKTFGSTGIDELNKLVKTSDGGYILCGRYNTPPDAWLIKLDSDGNEEWNKTFGGIRFDRLYSVIEVSSGGYLSVGRTGNSPTDENHGDLIAYRHNSTGHEVWNVTYGTNVGDDRGYNVIESADGSFIVLGMLFHNTKSEEIWLLKLSENGTKVWEQLFGGSQQDWGNTLLKLDDGYLLTSHSKSFGSGNGDNWIIKVDNNGNALWNQTHGYSSDDEFAWDMIQSSDGDFVLAGRILSKGAGGEDAWLVKLGLNEETQHSTSSTSSETPGFDFLLLITVIALVFTKRKWN